MRYIHFFGDAGYCGTDYHCFDVFPDSTSNEVLDALSADMCYDNADSYEYLYTDWGDFESEEDRETYYSNTNSFWKEVSQEEYDKLKEEYGHA